MKTFKEFLNERAWKYRIDLRDIWSKLESAEDETDLESDMLQNAVKQIMLRIKECPLYETSSELQNIVGEFEMIQDDEELNFDNIDYIMEMLYDWADNNDVWIATQI